MATTVLATVLGTMLAFGIVRGRYPGKALVNQISLAPLIVPIDRLLDRGLRARSRKLKLIGDWQVIVLGHTVHAIPFVVIVVGAALQDLRRELRAGGDEPRAPAACKAIWRVTLPQIRPALVSAMFLAFISSFDELVVAMFLGGSNMTLPKKMFDNIVNAIDPDHRRRLGAAGRPGNDPAGGRIALRCGGEADGMKQGPAALNGHDYVHLTMAAREICGRGGYAIG